MMTSWKCYECEGYNLFETSLVRINRLSFLIDDEEDVMPISTAMTYPSQSSHQHCGAAYQRRLT